MSVHLYGAKAIGRMTGTARKKVDGFCEDGQLHCSRAENMGATYVHKIACPCSAKDLKNLIIAHADCESKPEVGYTKSQYRFIFYRKHCPHLIKEKKQLWLGCQLDTNGQPFALLDIQTFANNTDNRVRVRLHFAHPDNFLDTVIQISDSSLLLSCEKLTRHVSLPWER